MTAVFKLLALMPLWLMQGVGWVLGWVVFAASSRYRRTFVRNARLAGVTGAQCWAAVGHAGQVVSELPRLWLGRKVVWHMTGRQHIEQALQRGKGIVFLTPHLGCFEVTAQAYAWEFGRHGQPMTVLYRPPRKPWLEGLFAQARQRSGMHTAPTTLAGVKQLLKALKAGECVGLLPDQVPPQGLGIWQSFFGQPAYTMTLSAKLALQTGATVLMAWGERLSWGRGYVVHVQDIPALSADLQEAVADINAAMERLILQAPAQYLWGYDRYKQPRKSASDDRHANEGHA